MQERGGNKLAIERGRVARRRFEASHSACRTAAAVVGAHTGGVVEDSPMNVCVCRLVSFRSSRARQQNAWERERAKRNHDRATGPDAKTRLHERRWRWRRRRRRCRVEEEARRPHTDGAVAGSTRAKLGQRCGVVSGPALGTRASGTASAGGARRAGGRKTRKDVLKIAPA